MKVKAALPAEANGRPEGGSALLLAILGVILMLALTGGLAMLLVADAKALAESSHRASASILAENGLEAAKYEIGESRDPDGDGVGTVNATRLAGSYSVTAQDLGNDRYELTSTGTAGGLSVSFKAVIAKSPTSAFPPSALAILGYSKDVEVELKSSASFDGGNSPAIVVTDQRKYDKLGGALLDAVNQGILPLGSITGSAGSLLSNVPFSIQHDPAAEGNYPICEELYTNFMSRMRGSFLPSLASTKLPGGIMTYGTSASPATVYLDDRAALRDGLIITGYGTPVKGGETLTGHGTLIVTNELRLENLASLNWTGNVIIIAEADKDARLETEGSVTVNGNVLIVGGTQKKAKLKVRPQGNMVVTGAVTLLSNFKTHGKAELGVEGPLRVDGLLQALGVEHKVELRSQGQLMLNGQMGLGPAVDHTTDSKLELKLEGYASLVRDTHDIENAAAALVQLDQAIGAPIFSAGLTSNTITTEAWWPYYP